MLSLELIAEGLWLCASIFPLILFIMAFQNIYATEMYSLGNGYALWEPSPGGYYRQAEPFDVGYIRDGQFFRMFNITLDASHPSNALFGVPDHFIPYNPGQLAIVGTRLSAPDPLRTASVTECHASFGGSGSVRLFFFCLKTSI